MNAVEIEQAISDLALEPFDPEEFPFAFLTAFGSKDTTVKRLFELYTEMTAAAAKTKPIAKVA